MGVQPIFHPALRSWTQALPDDGRLTILECKLIEWISAPSQRYDAAQPTAHSHDQSRCTFGVTAYATPA
jgi:hypothetical protein